MKLRRKIFIAVVAMSLTINVFAAGESATSKPVEGTRGFIDEINRPPEPYKGPTRSGAQVYAYRCAGCHDKTTQGAPMPGDDIAWGLSAQQGMDVLMKHTIEGYKNEVMPPRGSCGNCSDAELKAAVIYMLEASGVKPPQP